MTSKMIKMALAVVSLAVFTCACGKDPAGSAKDVSQKPRIGAGTSVALAVSNVKGGPFQRFADQFEAQKDKLFSAAPAEELNKFMKAIEDAGLKTSEFKWYAMTVGEIKDVEKELPEIGYACAFTHDIEKILAVVRAQLKEAEEDKISFAEYSIDGRKAWVVEGVEDMKQYAESDICFTSVDGKLLLLSTRKDGLKRLIDLYLAGAGEDPAWKDFAVSPAQPFCIRTMPIGAIVRKNVEGLDDLAFLDEVVPNGPKMVCGLGALSASVGVTADGKSAKFELSLGTADDKDADALVTLAKTGKMALAAQLKKEAKRDVEARKALEVVETSSLVQQGAKATVVIPVSMDDLAFLIDKGLKEALK